MRFSAVAVAGLAAVASAGNVRRQVSGSAVAPAPVYTTEVVTAYTTYCPDATVLTVGPSTYTVTSATTLTITHCPGGCTVTRPVTTALPTIPAKPTWVPTGSAAPASNGTATGYTWTSPAPTASSSSGPTPIPAKGAASKTTFGVAGALVAAAVAVAL